VDNTFTNQSSVVRFIEYNWHLPALGNGAADTAAGSILSMFNFTPKSGQNHKLFLDPATGEPTSQALALKALRKSG
jgi:phospholipase C